MTWLRQTLASIVVGGLIGAGLMAIPAARADTTEQNFLDILKAQGIPYSTPADALAAGHAVCAELFSGRTQEAVSAEVQDGSGLTGKKAAVFVSQSIAAFCPSKTAGWGVAT